MNATFLMKDLGACANFLGVRLIRNRESRQIHLVQENYAIKVLQTFKLESALPVTTPMDVSALTVMIPYEGEASALEIKRYQSAIGSLMFPASYTRPDLSFTASLLARFSHNPSPTHWKAAQRAIRYFGATKKLGITLGGTTTQPNSLDYHGFSDSDYAGDVDTRKSTSGYVFFMANGPISWKSARQNAVTLSSTEAEYYALSETAKEAKWHQNLLDQLGYTGSDVHPVTLFGDNTGALSLAENPEHHRRAKHIDIRQHFIRQEVQNGSIQLAYVPTSKMAADGLTKPLNSVRHLAFLDQLGMEEWD